MFFRRLRKPQIFVLLMLLAAVMAFLPRTTLAPVRNLFGLVTYFPQLAATRSARTVGDQVKDVTAPDVPGGQFEELRRANVALSNENVSLRQQVAELQNQVDLLKQLRDAGLKEGTLLPATVIALDAAGGRESLLLGKGSISDIRKGDWVASRLLIEAGEDKGVKRDSMVLAQQSLVGWIEDVGPVTARVVLFTDAVATRSINARVWRRSAKAPLRDAAGRDVALPLRGEGAGRMRLGDIDYRYVDNGQIAVGDWVVSQRSPRLPITLAIGTIKSLDRVPQKPTIYAALIEPIAEARSLDQVFVVDMSRTPPP